MKTTEELFAGIRGVRQNEKARRAEVLFAPLGEDRVNGVKEKISAGIRTNVTSCVVGGIGVPN